MLGAKDECIVCKYFFGWSNHYGLHEHHIFEGGTSGRRKTSDKYGLTCMLCARCHQLRNDSAHNKPNTGLDLWLKRTGQKYYEGNIGTREDFIRDFLKSYL